VPSAGPRCRASAGCTGEIMANAAGRRADAAAPAPSAMRQGSRRRGLRFALIAGAAVAMVAGLCTGLERLGLFAHEAFADRAQFHGALMISGFLGTLISLERAVALGGPAYAAPTASAAGGLALLAGFPAAAAALFLLAGAVTTAVLIARPWRPFALVILVSALAAAAWGVGALAWLSGATMPEVTGWWLAFLVLTIAAERLELGSLLAPPMVSRVLFGGAVTLVLLGALNGELAAGAAPLSGLGLIATAAWLLRYDIALRTIRMPGQPRFSALAMLLGSLWLAVAGLVLLLLSPATSAFWQDAAIHAVTIGFVLSMVFAHAPIILPVVTGLRLRVSSALYLPLGLLQLSLALRIAGDLLELIALRSASGPLTVLALVLYAGMAAAAGRKPRSPARCP
jgi:hypothetical protein